MLRLLVCLYLIVFALVAYALLGVVGGWSYYEKRHTGVSGACTRVLHIGPVHLRGHALYTCPKVR
jgi:hypothetical protein